MTSTKPPFLVIVIVFLMLYGASSLRGASASGPPGSGPEASTAVRHNERRRRHRHLVGHFPSRQPQFSPFTITVIIPMRMTPPRYLKCQFGLSKVWHPASHGHWLKDYACGRDEVITSLLPGRSTEPAH